MVLGINASHSSGFINSGQNWVTSVSPGGVITNIEYANGLFVSVGNSGILSTSTDATTWTTRTSNFGSTAIRSIVFGNGIWVAVGDSGQLRTSTDAITWTTRTSNFGSTTIGCVTYGNGIFFAGGQKQTARYSTDAITWQTPSMPAGSWSADRSIFANNIFICTVVGDSNYDIMRSTNGITWTSGITVVNIASGAKDIKYGNNIWVANTSTLRLRSTDSITWTTVANPGGINSVVGVVYGNGMFIIAQDPNISTSKDGITWTTVTNPTGSAMTRGVYGNGMFILANSTTSIRSSSLEQIY